MVEAKQHPSSLPELETGRFVGCCFFCCVIVLNCREISGKKTVPGSNEKFVKKHPL